MSDDIYFLDYETASPVDLKRCGAFKYASDPAAKILLCAVAKNDEPPVIWDCFQPDSAESTAAQNLLRDAIRDNAVLTSHNAPFEIAVSKYLWKSTFGFAPPALEQWRCTAAMCRRMAIPFSLDGAADFLKVPHQKNKEGALLIKRFCVGANPGTPHQEGTFTLLGEKITWAEGWRKFREYCLQDVRVERDIHKALGGGDLEPFALAGFQFDLQMADRGIPVNLDALHKAQKIVVEYQERLRVEFKSITGFSPSQTGATLKWLRERGYKGGDLRAQTMDDELEEDESVDAAGLPADARRALEIRSLVSYAAVKKLKAMIDCAGDGSRIRGSLLWSGALRTHRWSGRLIQAQNFKRPAKHLKKITHLIYDDICRGENADGMELCYGNPLEAIASCIRHFIEEKMWDADFRQIEARVLAWLAGNEPLLKQFREGGKDFDLYRWRAMQLFHLKSEAEVDEEQRFLGKISELACLAEGQLVLTDCGLIPIEKVSTCHRVWDGVEWVHHEGVIFKGVQKVITYQGLTATPDHIVFIEEGVERERAVPFGEAKSRQENLYRRTDRLHLGKEDSSFPEDRTCEFVRLRYRSMRLRQKGVSVLQQSSSGLRAWVPEVHGKSECDRRTGMADETNAGGKRPVHEPEHSELPQLWRTRYRVPIQDCRRSGCLDDGESWSEKGSRDRSQGQQRPLRSRESAMGYSSSKCLQHQPEQIRGGLGVRSERMALRGVQDTAVFVSVSYPESDTESSEESSPGTPERMASDAGMVRYARVYDIVNAGPRNRFTVSGVLVHNCGYMGGVNAYVKMAAIYDAEIDEKTAQAMVDRYRRENPQTVAFWKALGKAMKAAMEEPERKFKVGKVWIATTRKNGFYRMVACLPSGHKLIYPEPAVRMVNKKFKDKETKQWRDWEVAEYTYWGIVKGANWGRVITHPGVICENLCQGAAGDFMSHGAITASNAGYKINFLVHDQALAQYDPALSTKGFQEALCELPEWAADFPLEASCDVVPYYRKD